MVAKVVVLHGMAMCGDSMIRALGELPPRLDEQGFVIDAPNGSAEMSAEELDAFQSWLREHRATHAGVARMPRRWRPGHHFDWLRSESRPEGRIYHALESSLEVVAHAAAGCEHFSLIGFSQGALLSIIVSALAFRGDARFAHLRCAVFLSGFRPVFVAPWRMRYPIEGPLRALFLAGDRDPLYRSGQAQPERVARAFRSPHLRTRVVPGLGHRPPTDRSSTELIARFLRGHGAPSAPC